MHTYLSSDINECEMDNDCDEENGVCTNTNGSYLCSCKMGFRFSGIEYSCSGQSVFLYNVVRLNIMCRTIIIVHVHVPLSHEQ